MSRGRVGPGAHFAEGHHAVNDEFSGKSPLTRDRRREIHETMRPLRVNGTCVVPYHSVIVLIIAGVVDIGKSILTQHHKDGEGGISLGNGLQAFAKRLGPRPFAQERKQRERMHGRDDVGGTETPVFRVRLFLLRLMVSALCGLHPQNFFVSHLYMHHTMARQDPSSTLSDNARQRIDQASATVGKTARALEIEHI